jgi:hypothetical protein
VSNRSGSGVPVVPGVLCELDFGEGSWEKTLIRESKIVMQRSVPSTEFSYRTTYLAVVAVLSLC